MFNKITSLQTQKDYILVVGFADNTVKAFDLKPYINKYEPFKQLLNQPGLYESAKIDIGGYGIVWNDDLDVSSDGVYEKGVDFLIDSNNENLKNQLIKDYVEIRKNNKLSQKQLEFMTGIPQSSIARLESSKLDPKLSTMSKLLKALGYKLSIEKD